MLKQKTAQGLPINVIVMLMIGLLLFGSGIALFAKISTAGEDQIDDLNNQIKSDIAALECENNNGWLCAPSYVMNVGESKSFQIYATNIGDSNDEYRVYFDLTQIDDDDYGVEKDCGAILLDFAQAPVQIVSGSTTAFPFIVRSSRILTTPCSFVTTAYLYDELTANDDFQGATAKATVIIRVE